jgi:hypothetical protein
MDEDGETNFDITPIEEESKYSKSSAKYKTDNKALGSNADVSIGYVRNTRNVPNSSVLESSAMGGVEQMAY